MDDEIVKICNLCGAELRARDFLESLELQPIGMIFEKGDFSNNVYYFNHLAPGCGTTLTIPVEVLLPLIDEPVPKEVLTGSVFCEDHCVNMADLQSCGSDCHYAPFRRLLLKMKNG